MNISFVIKAMIISFFTFMIVFAISFVSSQKLLVDSNNYGVRDSVKESLNIAQYRKSGDITFNEETLIKTTLSNYLKNNNLSLDDITFEIYLDEETNIITVKIYTLKEMFNTNSEASYTFSYQVRER